jgi:hypothetical protein
MSVVRTFGRVERRDPPLSAVAQLVAEDMSSEFGECTVEIMCSGSADDYSDWITVAIRTKDVTRSERCIEAFAKRITRFGAVLLSSR